MKRTPLKRTAFKRKPPRRPPLDPDTYELVMRRDRDCVAHRRGFATDVRCYGRLHVHHVVLRKQGGTDDPDSLVVLCQQHHTWVHDIDRAGAEAAGLIRRA